MLPLFLATLIIACGPAQDPGAHATDVPAGDGQPAPVAQAENTPTATVTTGGDLETTRVAAESGDPETGEQPATLPEVAVPTPAAIDPRPLTALGDPEAPVTIVEYSDYQCPFCQRHFQQTMPALLENYIDTGRLYYVFKDYPIANLHPLAYRLHEAALCVGDAGGKDAYWDAHDLFFTNTEQFQEHDEAAMDEAILAGLATAELPDLENRTQAALYAIQEGIAEAKLPDKAEERPNGEADS